MMPRVRANRRTAVLSRLLLGSLNRITNGLPGNPAGNPAQIPERIPQARYDMMMPGLKGTLLRAGFP